jgi:hypothetical protein
MLVLCHETLPLPPPGGAAPRAILPVTLVFRSGSFFLSDFGQQVIG